ncbi:glycosyltransferase [Chamaesiphon sp. OTE_20_metabat_361]|uniref:glycosyltransferase n=1 Tax=Chamaesiphon sp. OTE_20_metabat_361 TaxID=2964689 RepID=UPI00286D3F91|nr:glycosyltransferase [Chamaesiphon sp. OTE_20_metabat_361]
MNPVEKHVKIAKRNEIILIDISTWRGHHAIYFKSILRSLIERNYFVHATCEDNTDLSKWIKSLNEQNCSVLDFKLSLIEKIFFKSLFILDKIIKLVSKNSPYQFSSVASILFSKNLIRKIGRDVPVFFADADTSLPAIPYWFAKLLMPSQWMTLVIQPSYKSSIAWGRQKSRKRFVAEKLFALPSCKAILVLHPIYLKFYESRFHVKKFVALPEITDVTIGKEYEVPKNIYHLAAGRKIVSITGALLPKRNLKLFLEAAQKLDPEKYFILAIGHLPSQLYTTVETQLIKKLSSSLSNNSYLRFDYYISEEGEFNQLLTISDIIYLQYQNHSFSSNILTKAIYLRKPVIIADNFIMKKVLKEYHWGYVVPQEPHQIALSIATISNDFIINEEKYQQFLTDFSSEKFNLAICNALELLEQ